ncbi:hypothetical protein E0K83_09380 [Gramella sp. BOM4]|nr:hypothetical protein [Christiangramia bathymodioli]
MQWLVFVISFLVLALSSFPCCMLEEIGENTLCIETHPGTEDDHSDDEPCSPFFNCGSCTGFAIQQNLEFSFIRMETTIPVFISSQDLFKSAYQNPDFKPPRSLVI